MPMDLWQGRQIFEKGHVGARAASIVQFPRPAEFNETPNHAVDRRNADAARNQYGLSRFLLERKMIPRRTDPKRCAHAKLVMNQG